MAKRKEDNPVYKYWQGRKGALHNLARPVMTPYGPFGSLNEAARELNMWYLSAWLKVNRGEQGYDTGWFWL